MAIRIEDLSGRYAVRPLAREDVPHILGLCRENPLFYACMCEEPSEAAILADMEVRPPGKAAADKYFFGFYAEGRLVALMDLIDGYPTADAVYIGFFMLASGAQGRGEGTRIVSEALDALRGQGFRSAELCCVRGNPQSERFWLKNGFLPDGRTFDRGKYAVVSMKKTL